MDFEFGMFDWDVPLIHILYSRTFEFTCFAENVSLRASDIEGTF